MTAAQLATGSGGGATPAPVPRFEPDRIPETLRAVPQWIAWSYVWNSAKGKWDKPPLRIDGRAGSSTDPTSQFPFAAALAAQKGRGFTGLGFVLTSADPFTGIDLDHCVNATTRAVEPWALEIVRTVDSYTEFSPSGTGLRIMAVAKLPLGGRRVGHFEIYDNGRYVTITGDHFPDSPLSVESRQEAIDALHARQFPKQSSPRPAPRSAPLSNSLQDSDLIDRAIGAKNGAEFERLWRGDTSAHADNHSEADLALCNRLAFWTDRDGGRVDGLFRQSGLMRPKWDELRGERTYGAITIAKALESVTEGYREPKTSAERETSTTTANPRYASAAVLAESTATTRLLDNLTDAGNADYVAESIGENLGYEHARKAWWFFDGSLWRVDDDGEVDRRIERTFRDLLHVAAELEDTAAAKRLATHAKDSLSLRKFKAIKVFLESKRPIRREQFDNDPMLLAVRNCVIDLRSGEGRPARREDFLTMCAGAVFDPEASYPEFEALCDRALNGDLETRSFHQRAVGYSATGSTVEQVFFLKHGQGRNGKSTIDRILSAALGTYAASSPFETFLQRSGDRASNDLARLDGPRFVTASEPDGNRKLSSSIIKQLTGEDTITARRLYAEYFEFRPSFKLWLSANTRPAISDDSLGMWRRVRLIPFDVTIPESEVDPRLCERIIANELSGVLNWIVAGALAWQTMGLLAPSSVRIATEEYRSENDRVGEFIAERCEAGPEYRETFAALFRDYLSWSKGPGGSQMSKSAFAASLSRHGVMDVKGPKGIRQRQGVRIPLEGWQGGSGGT
jgi:putative DNA primase/helicase